MVSSIYILGLKRHLTDRIRTSMELDKATL